MSLEAPARTGPFFVSPTDFFTPDPNTNGIALLALADGTVFIVRADHTPARAGMAAVRLLEQDGSALIGSVLSMLSASHDRRGSGDPLYYYPMYRAYHEG